MEHEEKSSLIRLPTLQELTLSEDHSILNGEQGINREKVDRCQIKANNDYEAIQCWLNEYRHKPTTHRTYQKEAERLLLWSVLQQRKSFSSLERDDFEAYLAFLDDPQPKDIWCANGGRGCKRGEPGWRPFTGGLAHSTKMTAISCIDSLLNYLVIARYLTFNPFSLMRKKKLRKQQLQLAELNIQERILSVDDWHCMLDTLENLPESTEHLKNEKERLRFIVHILYFLGLRVNELVTHTWNAFRNIDNQWWFYVMGKGDKPGRIPVNLELIRTVIKYRTYLKKSMYPDAKDLAPLVTSMKADATITARHINRLLKRLADETAKNFTDIERAKRIRKFSPHWLRHLSASMQDRVGIEFKHIRANHRHENDETTRRYVHALDKDRYQDMQKLTLRINKIE
jgi:site-specific recombinase XerD